jgi:hypothetical protein
MTSEKQFHRDFEKWLRERQIPFVTARMDRRSTIGNGKPDYCVTWMNRCVYVELKTDKGRLSPAQIKEIEYIRRSGNTVEVARGMAEATEAVNNILCEGKPSVGSYGACNYPLEGCFKELKRVIAKVPGNGTKNLNAASVLAEPREPECSGEARESIQASNSQTAQTELSDSCGGVQNFYIGDWKGMKYVFAPDQGGDYRMIRKASVIDIDNLPPLP